MKYCSCPSFLVLLLMLNFSACPSFAQSTAADPTGQPSVKSPTADDKPIKHSAPALGIGMLGSVATDTGKILTSPAHWDKSDWFRAALVAGTAYGLYNMDSGIRDWAQAHRSGTTDSIANAVRNFGNEGFTLPALAVLYGGGQYFKDSRLRDTASLGIESLLVTGIFTEGLKLAAHRVRPDDTISPSRFDGPSLTGPDDSFPSGHSSSAFALATVIASEYSDKKYVPPLAYGLATLTALSRINDNVHWASDVFVGSALGYFTAKALLRMHPGLNNRSTSITPVIGGGEMGVQMSHSF